MTRSHHFHVDHGDHSPERHGRSPDHVFEPVCERITVTLAEQEGVVGIEV